jgi:hypothetical protein
VTRRVAGGSWRLLAHHRLERKAKSGALYDDAHSIGSTAELAGPDREGHHAAVLEDTEFDELVVGSFLHVEQMDEGCWWMDIGGVIVNVTADRDGRPREVLVELEARDGVRYRIETEDTVTALPPSAPGRATSSG